MAADPDREMVATDTAKGLTGMAFVIKKLFTKEDPQMLHKVLGLLSLISFFYRYGYVYPRRGNLGFDGTRLDWFTMALHTALSTSSLIFHVLRKRILKKPYIIWEEYRLHAISFSLRCTAVFIAAWAGANRFVLFPTVMIWHIIADEITRQYGTTGQTTVRGTDRLPWRIKLLTRFYGFYQFCAIASHVLPDARKMDMAWNTLIAIQSSAFLMTLFRKGLIPYAMHGIGYTLCLILSFYHIVVVHTEPFFLPGVALLFGLRVKLGINKYVLWCTFAAVAALPDIIQMAELQGPAAQVEQMAWSHINQGQQLALDNTPPFVIDGAKFGYAQYEALPGWDELEAGTDYVATRSMDLINESGIAPMAAEYLARSVGQGGFPAPMAGGGASP